MAKSQHLLDQLSVDVAEWIEATSDDVANALTEGGVAPFAANVDNKEKLAYFSTQVYLPDGSINVEGRNKLMTQYGPDGYSGIMRTVLHSMGGLPPIPQGAFDIGASAPPPAAPAVPPPPAGIGG